MFDINKIVSINVVTLSLCYSTYDKKPNERLSLWCNNYKAKTMCSESISTSAHSSEGIGFNFRERNLHKCPKTYDFEQNIDIWFGAGNVPSGVSKYVYVVK